MLIVQINAPLMLLLFNETRAQPPTPPFHTFYRKSKRVVGGT
jgi:hypothetical protein